MKIHKNTARLLLLTALVLPLAGLTACGAGNEGTDGAAPDAAAPADTDSGAGADEGSLAGDVANGEARFAPCAGCHGPDGSGIEGLGKNLRTSTFLESLSDAEAVSFLKTGRPAGDPLNTTGVDMPPKGGDPSLTDQDLTDIVAYLRTLD
jgi:disulfide bond formation protein DsbB